LISSSQRIDEKEISTAFSIYINNAQQRQIVIYGNLFFDISAHESSIQTGA
jgi:hypothetical protein